MNKKPPELHIIDGTKPRTTDPALLPQKLKKRIPKAFWDDPDEWNKERFISETADFLFEVYGIGSDQDQHLLQILAEHIEIFINTKRYIKSNNIIINQNNNQTKGPNPAIAVLAKETEKIIHLCNELGLSPRSRLSANKFQDDTPVAKFLRGPKG
jgi:P27 family predicted phage terminase small subunit